MEYKILQKYFIKDITKDILKYANEYVLLEWIDVNKLHYYYLSLNPNAIDLLIQNQDKINWEWLSRIPNAIDLLKQNKEKINWYNLSKNPNAIDLLEPRIVHFSQAKSEQTRDELREQNKEKVDWNTIWNNPNIFKLRY